VRTSVAESKVDAHVAESQILNYAHVADSLARYAYGSASVSDTYFLAAGVIATAASAVRSRKVSVSTKYRDTVLSLWLE